MKAYLAIVFIFFYSALFSQENAGFGYTKSYFDSNHIRLNVLEPPSGYKIYYNCDSMLFIRGDFSDTIKIWTPALEWTYTLEQFKDIRTKPEYGKTVFPNSILNDGRILVDTYGETMFVFRNDSLFELEDTVSKPQMYFDIMVKHTMGEVNDSDFKRITDSVDLIYRDKHVFVSKLIFAKNMFKSGRKKIKLSKNVNYLRDEIELEREWTENSRKCFVVRINNGSGDDRTSYAYAINEDLKFIWWEGCALVKK